MADYPKEVYGSFKNASSADFLSIICLSPEGIRSVFLCCSSSVTPWCLDSVAFMTHGRLFNHLYAEAVDWFLLISTFSPLRNDLFSFALWINWLSVLHYVFPRIFMVADACSSLGDANFYVIKAPHSKSLTILNDFLLK